MSFTIVMVMDIHFRLTFSGSVTLVLVSTPVFLLIDYQPSYRKNHSVVRLMKSVPS